MILEDYFELLRNLPVRSHTLAGDVETTYFGTVGKPRNRAHDCAFNVFIIFTNCPNFLHADTKIQLPYHIKTRLQSVRRDNNGSLEFEI
ncbi:unnamed protein product [Caenorhabditis nigoni]